MINRLQRPLIPRLVCFVSAAILAGHTALAQPVPGAACAEWQTCRQLALDAASRGQYELFHDLAWRTVQTGPSRDPDLMYLLARAQSLSGRPYDALVMLQRLAEEMGVAPDVLTNDFERVRAHPGWAAVQEIIERVSRAGGRSIAAPAAPTPTVRAPTASATPAATSMGMRESGVARFAARAFTPGGLAYDAVSRRFLYGDQYGRKLMVVGDGSDHAVELVRGDSAGFYDVRAMAIDTRRGDLWVVSAAPNGSGALHRLQLISGRPLATIQAASDLEPVAFTDVAVTPSGIAIVLDAAGRRLLKLPLRGSGFQLVASLSSLTVSSIAVSDDDSSRIAYVAHAEGLLGVNLNTGMAAPLSPPPGVDVTHFDRIRWHRGGLVGLQRSGDETSRIVRLQLSQDGQTITSAATIEATIPSPSTAPLVTVSGDDLAYLVPRLSSVEGGNAGGPAVGSVVEYVVRRVPLLR